MIFHFAKTVYFTDAEVDGFVGYVLGFYQVFHWVEDWDLAPMTEEEVRAATRLVLDHYDLVDDCHPLGPVEDPMPPPFDGGSHAREVVRDIILTRRGLTNKWPEGLEWGDLVQKMLRRESAQLRKHA